MSTSIPVSLVALAMFFIGCMSGVAQTTIKGSLAIADGTAFPRVMIYLIQLDREDPPPIDSVKTDADGRFQLYDPGVGSYMLRMEAEDGRAWFLDPIPVDTPATFRIEIRLRHPDEGSPLDNFIVTISDPRIAALYSVAYDRRQRELRSGLAYLRNQASGKAASDFSYDYSSDYTTVRQGIVSASDPLIRQAWMIDYADLLASDGSRSYDTVSFRQLLDELPPTSRLWKIFPHQSISCANLTGEFERYQPYLEQITRIHPDTLTRVHVAEGLLYDAVRRKRQDLVDMYARRIIAEFPGTFVWNRVYAEYDPDRPIMAGKPIPSFSLGLLDDTSRTVTETTFKGKYLLVDVWATTCGPCIAELPGLYRAYERFRRRNFEVLSISVDSERERVRQFRARGKYPMPWQQAWAEGGTTDPINERFGVVGIPRTFLVGPDGTIVVEDSDLLRGDQLQSTLEKYLGDGAEGSSK